MRTFNQPLSQLTPEKAMELLKHGNFRFINNIGLSRDLLESVTKDGQQPFAAIFSCMDSRTSAELIFDQGFGDIFSIRIAGNVVSGDVLGSLEYAAAVVGVKLIVVMGHTNCGAIIGACNHVEMGHLTGLLAKIQPAIEQEQMIIDKRNGSNAAFVQAVTQLHVQHSAREIVEGSSIIKQLVDNGKVGIIPALYDIATGHVHFYEQEAIMTPITESVAVGA